MFRTSSAKQSLVEIGNLFLSTWGIILGQFDFGGRERQAEFELLKSLYSHTFFFFLSFSLFSTFVIFTYHIS
jgi:hypothetical protein